MAGCSLCCRSVFAAAGACSHIPLPAPVSLPATPRPSCIMLLHGSRALSLMPLQTLTMCVCFASGAQERQYSSESLFSTSLPLATPPVIVVRLSFTHPCQPLRPPDACVGSFGERLGHCPGPLRRLARVLNVPPDCLGTPCDYAVAWAGVCVSYCAP